MICRNCSAIIPENSEKCPNCNKYPGKKPKKKSTTVIWIVLIAVFVVCFLFGLSDILKSYSPLFSTTESQLTTNKAETTLSDTLQSTTLQEFELSQSETYTQVETSVNENEASTEKENDKNNPLFSFPISTQYVFEYDEIRTCNRAFVKIDKNTLKQLSQEQFKDYIMARIYKVNYCWFTIDFGDSTGIVFQSGNFSLISYGEIDELGRIEKLFGYILLKKDGSYVYKAENEISVANVSQQSTFATQIPETTETTEISETETTKSEETTQSSADQTSVFVTQNGKKFHTADCYYLSSTATKMTKQEAIDYGYSPCSKCNP